jgi:general nucleoside transport system permease protein
MSISNSYQIGSLILALAFIAVVILLVGGSPLAVVTSMGARAFGTAD